ncbi:MULTISPECIES: helix-turn-helix domain-containing protein [Cryobacterium]|uniref:IclR family transcriptional regulator n=1 Tax=Cryobacterium breve TaxID=1259258 RepID=A0ABY2J338_9MICO|nr:MULTISPECIES: helix-turn-helix domain-containing protein [Cryobacterium]TFC91035.1 IclR family transcriptional regulator [Cryobacterium sp. TmT3-12]TFC99354.1 IclR family transcriptional regulator [Cryobacterium breve]
MSKQHQTLISSVQRALGLVDLVSASSRPLPVKAVARAAGLSLGTTYNLTRTLVFEGYLAAEPDGLVLGARFPTLRTGTAPGEFLARVRQTLRGVAREHGAPAHLSRFESGEVRLVDVVDATGTPRVGLRDTVSGRAPAAAIDRQILAQLSREQRADFLARHPPDSSPPFSGSRRAVRLDHRLGAQVWGAESPGERLTACVAVPVHAPGVIAALAVSVPGGRPDGELDLLVRRLRVVAVQLSVQLGTVPLTFRI